MESEGLARRKVAWFKHYDYNLQKLIPVDFDAQILPGTFEHTLCYLIQHECEFSVYEWSVRG